MRRAVLVAAAGFAFVVGSALPAAAGPTDDPVGTVKKLLGGATSTVDGVKGKAESVTGKSVTGGKTSASSHDGEVGASSSHGDGGDAVGGDGNTNSGDAKGGNINQQNCEITQGGANISITVDGLVNVVAPVASIVHVGDNTATCVQTITNKTVLAARKPAVGIRRALGFRPLRFVHRRGARLPITGAGASLVLPILVGLGLVVSGVGVSQIRKLR